ncbi:haloacid dehalogenase type II [Marinilabilia salmonicolor]|uniref:2-haloacid dehalogenase n=1 Tax=Marinilabilia salmonicolor TaxID=989 RepID=A0A368VF97_9BACT|nr:haloacid dehalogenase type II [Marinilabilia salmonicolor]RCW38324.1 2-haloacid dehalogenase [Marinilabilia salmonicolor]
MITTIAFDIYGTLIDPNEVNTSIEKFTGLKAGDFMEVWRNKQLEYSFRRGLMKDYVPFPVCTLNALEFADTYFETQLTDADKKELMEVWKKLPAYNDVKSGLKALKNGGVNIYAFSNGRKEDIKHLLEKADILDLFDGTVSVETVRSFKPDPAVYEFLAGESGSGKSHTWLVSSNPFDVIGAIKSGLKTAWLKRNPSQVFDPWGVSPDVVTDNILGLQKLIAGKTNSGVSPDNAAL